MLYFRVAALRGLAVIIVGTLLLLCSADWIVPRASEAAPSERRFSALSLQGSELVGLRVDEGGFALDGTLSHLPAYAPYAHAGLLTTQPWDAGMAVASAQSAVQGTLPADSHVDVDVRGSVDGVNWTPWYPTGPDETAAFGLPVRFLQHRVTLLADAESPTLTGLQTEFEPARATVMAFQARTNPTVKVFASREGLVGRTTANGHVIQASDRFVALPSRRVLNPKGKQDYRVRINYQGRSVEAPVWDTGPWNTKDNYWDDKRESFGELPRFVPQAFAAWADNHNAGKDGSGRWVSFPAALDISDAAFLDDLKLKQSSWVDVTFLWVDAASPPAGPTPSVLGLKPQGSKVMQPSTVAAAGAPAKPQTESARAAAPVAAPPSASAPPPAANAATVPEASRTHTLHFAQVSVDAGVDSWIVLLNPADHPVNARLQFNRVDGQRASRDVTVSPGGRFSVSAGALVGAGEYSLLVESEGVLAAERSMYLGADAVTSIATLSPSRTWFFPEGSSEATLESVLALFNPGGQDAQATLTFLGDKGEIRSVEVGLAGGGRTLVNFAEFLAPGSASTIIESDQPLVAERFTYSGGRAAVDGTVGSVAAAPTWTFANATTTANTHSWLVLLNPNGEDATVQASFIGEGGPLAERTFSVPARSRAPIFLNEELPDQRFGIILSASQPIVAERSEYRKDGGGVTTASVSIMGTINAASSWALPEGATPTNQNQVIALLNPGDGPTVARIEFVTDKGRVASGDVQVAATSIALYELPADVSDVAVSARVTADRPVAVERQVKLAAGRGITGGSGIRL